MSGAEPRTIKLLIAYDGTGYAGWQRQENAPTIQAEVEKALAVMTRHGPVVHGAGRTDAGVHALGMVAHFQTDCSIPPAGFRQGLNSLLPEDIRVLHVADMDNSFHARYSAVSKTYLYQMSCEAIPLPTRRLYWGRFRPISDVDAMVRCLDMLRGCHDFSSFEATGSRSGDEGRGARRTILAVDLRQQGPDRFVIEITGDGFLRHMVRNIVGTVVEVGQQRRTVEDFKRIFKTGDRRLAGPTAPARGLFLKEVHYGLPCLCL